MIPSESSILLKNFVSWNFMLRHCITVSLWSFTKTLNQFFDLSRARENLEISIPVWFVQLNESKEFWGNLIGSYFNKWTLSQKYKMGVSLKTAVCKIMILIWLSPAMNQIPEKFYFPFLTFYTIVIRNGLWKARFLWIWLDILDTSYCQ